MHENRGIFWLAWLAFIGFLVLVVLLVIVWPLTWSRGPTSTPQNAAQSNLENTVIAAKTYRADSGGTFSGLTDSSSASSSIQEMGTGLSFVTDGTSNGPHIISTAVGGGGTDVVFVA